MHAPTYKMLDPELLRRLMQRTGTGASLSIRELAAAAGVSKSTVHNMLAGSADFAPATAHAVAKAIGVDVLILFAPVGRSVPPTEDDESTDEAPAVVAA